MSKRLHRVSRTVGFALAAATFVMSGTVLARHPTRLSPFSADDQIFIKLHDAARDNDPARAAQLASLIQNFPAPAYLSYYQIKPRLFNGAGHANLDAPDAPVLSFLQRYDGQAIADRLRNDYLRVLGARHDWHDFDSQYSQFVLDDDTQVKCYALESRAARGVNVADAARALLVEPKWYGDGCVDLIAALDRNQQFTSEDVWQQIRQAYEQGATTTGRRLVDALGAARPDPLLLEQATNQPRLLLAKGVQLDAASHQIALLALTQVAASDPAAAAATFTAIAPALTLAERGIGWGTIAYQAATRQLPGAVDWYRLSANALLSSQAYEWRTRSALLAGDWTMVRWSIEQMPAALRAQPAWVYWYARALKESGDAADAAAANQAFGKISGTYTFYGQLASEALGQKIVAPPQTKVTDEEVEKAGQTPGFELARRFYALQLRTEGNREWNWRLRGMTDRQLLAVAEYARRIELYDRAVSTADRTQTEHDFSLRYLAPFRTIVERDAQSTGFGVEWAYGLIRQESRFIINARSDVGAGGLMQVMPNTAEMVARKIGLGTISRARMNDIDTNILLGTYYLSMIYNQLDRSAVLATAGYNAGPGRPRKWQANLPRPVEGAIFAETIPFNETRDYVKNVLSNTVYYAALFDGRPQSLTERLGHIEPR
ncbi:lytic transglycosylase domain-containing protein [Paraburkholderia hospita]|uniref:Lytic transglycosylase n=1 Tax=Paraburkholderia hospita TaxID=169430 RepID=A0AAN1JHG3_9BURK|nr:lytic transglycosylase domain-containing protein [Paraburkholderia hospita]AUT72977.1 lytic transglycosylase [Paraburkholderia hospita]EIM96211.1 lytic transglycosylase [Paraburkholderia hospita]OUL73246.1 lytic transglycosylase [Paraburkholderia hospita]OUL77746.1 lytic transglycosylase [Paraburkholderia hospita]SEI27732.1 soluble lytic murein transglycosylase [Paraburkholderia hospita]